MAGKTVNELTLKLNADMAELKRDLTKARQEIGRFQKGIQSIGAGFKNLFAAGAILTAANAIGTFTKDMLILGGQVNSTKAEFDKLNQPNLLANLRKETDGTVSDLKLMQMALNADDMGVGFDKLGVIINYARNEVRQTGGDVKEMVDTLVNGIGKDSVKALNQLGISNKDFQEEFAKTGDKVAAITNIMQKRLTESGGVLKTSADVTAKWAAEWENLKAGFASLIDKILVKIAPIIDEIWTKIKTFIRDSLADIVDFINGWIELYNESMAFRLIVTSIASVFKFVWSVVKVVVSSIVDALQGAGRILAYVFNPKNWGEGFADGLKEVTRKNSEDMKENFVRFGEEFVDNINEGIKAIQKGKIDLIDLTNSDDGSDAVKPQDKNDPIDPEKVKKVEAMVKSLNGAFAKGFEGIKTYMEDLDKLVEKAKQFGSDMGNAFGQFITDTKERTKQMGNAFSQFGALASEKLGEAGKKVKEQMDNMSGMVNQFIADLIVTFVETAVDSIGGGIDGLINIFNSILRVIANFMKQMGSALISLGIAEKAFKMIKNPYAKIAAGVALIAAAAVANKIINDGPKFKDGGIVPGYQPVGDRVSILANSGEMILNKGQQASLFRQINGGGSNGGGILTARVSGSDLWFILNKEEKRRKNIF